MFPYLSAWILLYAIVAFLILIIVPAPYGKFSKEFLPLQIDPRLAWGLQHGLVLVGLVLGWWESDKLNTTTPQTNKGWTALTFLWVHFAWRGIISQVVLTKHGSKQTSILLPLFGIAYFIPAGMNFRHMCAEITEVYEFKDTIFLVGASVCLIANAFVEIMYNQWRLNTENCYQLNEYQGAYVKKEEIGERFGLLYRLGIVTPNYLFEVIEWGLFSLFVMKWEAFWWFVATILFLLPRSIWTSHWFSTVPNVSYTQVPKVVQPRNKNKYNF